MQAYRQEQSDGTPDDSLLFVILLVPLHLKTEKRILRENARSLSTRFCRPIKLMFTKETAELSRLKTKNVEDQIKAHSLIKIVSSPKNL